MRRFLVLCLVLLASCVPRFESAPQTLTLTYNAQTLSAFLPQPIEAAYVAIRAKDVQSNWCEQVDCAPVEGKVFLLLPLGGVWQGKVELAHVVGLERARIVAWPKNGNLAVIRDLCLKPPREGAEPCG